MVKRKRINEFEIDKPLGKVLFGFWTSPFRKISTSSQKRRK